MKRRICLTLRDYKKILKYYKIKYPVNSTFKNLKMRAENALISKICKCTKKLRKKVGGDLKANGICETSVLRKTKLNLILAHHRFTCKKNAHFIPLSGQHNALHKYQ